MTAINRALGLIPRRAEKQQADRLRDTFVDSGVAGALASIDHQVLYGRRGTGKTHAFRFIESNVRDRGDVGIYVDLRQIGSPEGLFEGDEISPVERAGRLLVDLLNAVIDELLARVLEDDTLAADVGFVGALDQLDEALGTVIVVAELEVSEEHEQTAGKTRGVDASATVGPGLSANLRGKSSSEQGTRRVTRQTTRGQPRVHLNFSDIAGALKAVAGSMTSQRTWLFLDEWGAVPRDVQPMLAEFLVRCVLPLSEITVKISAIEQEAVFRAEVDGKVMGIELGADVAADLNLDEFMVYEENEERSREFFLDLFYKHLSGTMFDSGDVLVLGSEVDVLQGFTDRRAFDELVRAAEGVPRDAINIGAKVALRARGNRISIPDVRVAARQWYQSDKEQAVRGRANAEALLRWIIDEVIRQRKARGFLVNQRSSESELLRMLFEARVLHVVRRGYSAQDQPGERYDVWVIDYGAYVDLINTKNEPRTLFPLDDEWPGDGSQVDVPSQDLRAIRRAVLDLDRFEARHGRS